MSATRAEPTSALARLCEARESVVTNGPASGCRQIELRAAGGIDLRILPDRGFDIAHAWWRGLPIAWVEPSRETAPAPNLGGLDWIRGFSGGLLTTCGLRHIGRPTKDHGLHGRFSHQRSQIRSVGVTVDGDTSLASANALIAEPDSFGPLLEVDRTITTSAGIGRMDLRDIVVNRGLAKESVKLLYHLNFTYQINASPCLLINGEPVSDEQLETAKETVELSVPHAAPVTVELRNEELESVTTLTWDTTVLNRLYIWKYPTNTRGGILAIEPAMARLLDPDADDSSALTLDAGECIETGFTVTVCELDAPCAAT